MYVNMMFLAIIIQLPYTIISIDSCIPNTRFVINGFLCVCNHEGRWNQASCKLIGRRSDCMPGEVVRRGCTQCMCRDNNFMCDNSLCFDEITKIPILQKLSYFGPTCTPFRSYFVNCSLCICPASGRTSEAQCVVDLSCPLLSHASGNIRSAPQIHCLPNVMYLFPCLQCLCSEHGFFIPEQCANKCHQTTSKPNRRCIPGSLYRVNCNVCQCPENSIHDNQFCEEVECNNQTLRPIMQSLSVNTTSCIPHVFTKPRCLYCDCKPEGVINENSCVEINCLKAFKLKREISIKACSPGELVPICIECFCIHNKSVRSEYCTRNCSIENKLGILDKVLNNSVGDLKLIDDNQISEVKENNKCVPNSLYLDNGRYCLCPKHSDTSLRACTLYYKYKNKPAHNFKQIELDFNAVCEPNTLVEFGCNTCFCSKEGKINPKWCTYNDCEASRIIQESHKSPLVDMPIDELQHHCMPGSIVLVKCNYCICPESGIFNDRVCTKNECEDNETISYEKFACEPLTYYEVDCNICLCPSNGLKNIKKCTVNSCETNFLRSGYCEPGTLFVDECNVCVCPTNSKKEDKVCTNHNCDVKMWTSLKFQQTLLSEVKVERNLDVCFPGEEFTEGCKLCVCPEEGLKMYGTCDVGRCGNSKNFTTIKTDYLSINEFTRLRERRDAINSSKKHNITSARIACTPGSMYIIRCKQCICPYRGSLYDYCRQLPKGPYCEQRYPNVNYTPAVRRNSNRTSFSPSASKKRDIELQKLTKYPCNEPIMTKDECFICECEDNFLIVDHCFKSSAQNCLNATPSFLDYSKIKNWK